MSNETPWEPTTRPVILCAANLLVDGTLLIGVRHWDTLMRKQFKAKYGEHSFRQGRFYRVLRILRGLPRAPFTRASEGFIDQFTRFYNRKEAMMLAKQNGQIIVPDHQMLSLTDLHSEDVW